MAPVPHMRGDEPHVGGHHRVHLIPFPICVGMNRILYEKFSMLNSVPHMRGDEPPALPHAVRIAGRSPYAWG